MSAQAFTDEQKQYLQGFAAGSDIARVRLNLPSFGATLNALGTPANVNPGPNGAVKSNAADPDAPLHAAQDKTLAAGKKLTNEEKAKREKHPLDRWDEIAQHAREGKYPKGTDVLMWKYHGMFYVAPAQDSFMSRLRFPCGLITSAKLRAVADLSERFGGGYADCTTRGNLQIREIQAENAAKFLIGLQDAGIVARGSGADNIRNVTGTPTAGVDPQELYDVRDLCVEMNHTILFDRTLYGLPRKFNIAFDGAGVIASLEDTNDIGFAAVRVSEGRGVEPGIYFRLQLGGITGHKDFARDTGVMLTPDECIPVACAILRVYLAHGDRTDRRKARLKYVLDAWGFDKFLNEVEREYGSPLRRFPIEECDLRPLPVRDAHIGVQKQKDGNVFVGVVLPVGRMTVAQMRGLAKLSDVYGSGMLRLTVWQNILISDVREEDVPIVKREIEALGLAHSASSMRAGLIACTGNAGCKYANANTKKHALETSTYLESVGLNLDTPLNLHFTGCPNSCAQHYIGDLGFLGTKVEIGDDMVEGYHVYIGGGAGPEQNIGRELKQSVVAEEVPHLVESLLRAYLEERQGEETFHAWSARQPLETLQIKLEAVAA